MKKPVRKDLAMTGRLTLTGKILGSLVKTIIFPEANRRDVDELPNNGKEGIHVFTLWMNMSRYSSYHSKQDMNMLITPTSDVGSIVRMLEGEGLAERWDEWQNLEVTRQEEFQRKFNCLVTLIEEEATSTVS
ncbi:unnamed protein product [Arabidopsis thaliana]|uniref:(thale cress) hypothetical protein n=1 Tax=Arabidopsis thaliana TaxID=3702 RepID=A0A7G2DTM1_ARATH|nr:unnamed protein product [Arabidopsis thaliana]